MGDAEVVRETGASVMGGGVFVCWDCGGSGAWDGAQSELFCIAGVGGGSGGNAGSSVFETEMCSGGACGDCRDGISVLSDCV